MSSLVRVTTRKKLRVTTDINAIQGQFLPGGDIWGTAKEWGNDMRAVAISTTPRRTGDMSRAFARISRTPSNLNVKVGLRNEADYAIFVHEGTMGPIYPNNWTGKLWIRPYPHSYYLPVLEYARYGGRTPVDSVSGQRAQPWIRQAMETVLRFRGAAI
jgi:hypothetical protein